MDTLGIQNQEVTSQQAKGQSEGLSRDPLEVDGLVKKDLDDLDFYHQAILLESSHKRDKNPENQRAEGLGNMLRSFFAEAPIAYFALSSQGYVVDANRLAGEYWGLAPSDLIGVDFGGIVEPSEIKKLKAVMEKVLQSGKRQSIELKCKKVDGTLFWGMLDFTRPLRVTEADILLCWIVDTNLSHVLDDVIKKTDVGLSAATSMGFFTRLLHFLISYPDVDAAVITILKPPYDFKSIAIGSCFPCEDKIEYSRKKIISEFVKGEISELHEPSREHIGPLLEIFQAKDGLSLFLCDAQRQISGELAIVTRGAFENPILTAHILKVVSVRAAAELDRLKVEYQLRSYRDRLEFLVRKRTIELERKSEEFRQNNLKLAAEISRREQVEAVLVESTRIAEEATQVKSVFLANMSHEIRTPMNGIIGMTALFETKDLSDKNRRYLDQIRESGQSLMRIINDILDVSKLDSGCVKFEVIEFDLRDLVLNIFTGMSVLAQKKDLYFLVDFPYDQPHVFRSDPVRVRQVLENLVNNAIKFTEKGCVLLKIRYDTVAHHLVSEVFDTGIGLPEEKQTCIFERFYQADSSTVRRFGGTGLGLTICKKIVEVLGGEISFTSAFGKGSCFTFWIPIEPAMEQVSPSGLQATYADCAAVLCIENPLVADTWCRLLMSLGINCLSPKKSEVDVYETLKSMSQIIVLADHLDSLKSFLGGEHEFLSRSSSMDLVLLGSASVDLPASWRSVHVIPKATLMETFLVDRGWLVQNSPVDVPPKSDKNPGDLRKTDVLVAEDNLVNCEVATGMLESFGCQVSIAHDGSQAVERYENHDFDIVFMDCLMPVMDGFEALKSIRKGPKPRGYVVALTANAMAGDRENCLAAGFDAYLSKPMNLNDLGKVLKGAAERRSSKLWEGA